MIAQVQLTFLLVVVVLVNSDAAPTAEQNSPDTQEIVHVVNLDKEFDALLPSLRSFIIDSGLDPMELIDISEALLPDLPGIFQGHIDLKKGWLQNLSTVKRRTHVVASYSDKCLELNMDLGFNVIDFNYEYHLTYMLYQRSGDMNGRLFDLGTNVKVTVDLEKYHIRLDSIKFSNVGDVEINFQGHLLDPILNLATKVVTFIFENIVLEHIEERAFMIFSKKIDELNKLFPQPNRTELMEHWL